MADVQPFRGIRYSPTAGDLAALTSPPYDVITPAERDALEERDPHNIVRVILSRDEPGDSATSNKYTRAADLLRGWLSSGVMIHDEEAAYYLYEQRFVVAGTDRVQRGILAAVALDEDSVLPHERTMAGPVADRLELTRTTHANLEPIIVVYAGEAGPGREAVAAAALRAPAAAFTTDDGVQHRLVPMVAPLEIAAIRSATATARLVIADGHHRHRTALAYREERRARDGAGPWDAMMMLVVDAGWSGPSVLPIHRIVAGIDSDRALDALSGPFEVEPAATRDLEELERELGERRASARVFALVGPGRAWWLTLADKAAADDAMPSDRSAVWRDLDVAVLQSLVFERLLGVTPGYAHSTKEVDDAFSSGRATLGFLVAPTPFDAVRRLAENREAMPPKSTFFFPKPRSGVVIRLLDEPS